MTIELVLHMNNGAFTVNEIASGRKSPTVVDYCTYPKNSEYERGGRLRMKYLTMSSNRITFSEYSSQLFLDWGEYDYPSFIITWPVIGDDFALYKQGCYLSCFFDRTEKEYVSTDEGIKLSVRSGCTAQGLWDWHGDDSAWSRNGKTFRAYKLRHDLPDFSNETGLIKYPDDVIITKNKLRGRGRSLSLRFSSEEGKDMKLIGWHIPLTQVDKV